MIDFVMVWACIADRRDRVRARRCDAWRADWERPKLTLIKGGIDHDD